LIPVFFLYGLAFFLLGFAIFMQPRKESSFRLSRYIALLGLFGLLHGVNEWLDMFLLLGTDYWADDVYTVLEVSRFAIGKISYIFLFLFGLLLTGTSSIRTRLAYKIFLTIFILLLAVLFVTGLKRDFDKDWFLGTDLISRYFVAFPAAILSGLGIWLYRNSEEVKSFKKEMIPFWFNSCAVLFCAYAVLAGLIVKETAVFPSNVINSRVFLEYTGVPVQVFRALCAVGLTFFMVRILKLFEFEQSRKLENAYREIVKISTDEQERIGRDIHDDLCQEITGIQLLAKAAENGLEPEMQSQKESFKKIGEVARIATNKARAIAKNLYPVEITDRGLIHALNEYCFRVSEIHNVECQFLLSGTSDNIDHMISTHLFRIAQEAVSNAIRHGRATQIKVNLNLNNEIILYIEDNGIASERHDFTNDGMGMKIMKYRVSIAGGHIRTGKSAVGGMNIEVKIKK